MPRVSPCPLKTLKNQSLFYVVKGIETDQWHEMDAEATQNSVQ